MFRALFENYAILKEHFDMLILGGHRYSNGCEPIRMVYQKAFGRKIPLLDIYESEMRIKHNPIEGLITLVGPYDDLGEYPTGFISVGDRVMCVNHFTDEITKGIPDGYQREYIEQVYNVINSVISMDKFYRSDHDAIASPHVALIRLYPFYLTFHHALKIGFLNNQDVSSLFIHILEREILYGEEQIKKLIDSLESNPYSIDSCDVYRTMTCCGQLDLFT
ncbi:MAG: hypothetical protein NC489_35745 [Ruminococcus flavefaciens]|nr:hypothetical protein [Ruminococcus flavefaciens]